jgi:hypothetical protein
MKAVPNHIAPKDYGKKYLPKEVLSRLLRKIDQIYINNHDARFTFEQIARIYTYKQDTYPCILSDL